ncbi:integrase core domain-containing protein [Nocardia stercoris]|uniref:integrase core domain-containing protein n=1 Tax=Nocardia stercoris TaxID=2483361 RepID=UPI0038995F3F
MAGGRDTEIITFLDDHSRYALSVTAHPRVTGLTVVEQFGKTTAAHGIPASTLTDNGLVYTTRFAGGGTGGRNGFETELAALGVTQKNSRPNHPTTCGKVERFQQTMKKWLKTQTPQPRSLPELQACSTNSPTTTTTTGPTGPCPTTAPQPPPTEPGPRQHQAQAPARETTSGSATTPSTPRVSSRCVITGACTTSGSAEPTPSAPPGNRTCDGHPPVAPSGWA